MEVTNCKQWELLGSLRGKFVWRKHSARDSQRYEMQVLEAILAPAASEQHFYLAGIANAAQLFQPKLRCLCINKSHCVLQIKPQKTWSWVLNQDQRKGKM